MNSKVAWIERIEQAQIVMRENGFVDLKAERRHEICANKSKASFLDKTCIDSEFRNRSIDGRET
jgi:hypothetical protein